MTNDQQNPKSQIPMLFYGKWAEGWMILAAPDSSRRILKYEDLRKEVRMRLKQRRANYENLMKCSFLPGSVLRRAALHANYEQFMKCSYLPEEGMGQKSKVDAWRNLPFAGGWAGFFSYDLGAEFLGIRQRVKNDLQCPEVYFAYCDKAFLRDPSGKWWFVRALEGGGTGGRDYEKFMKCSCLPGSTLRRAALHANYEKFMKCSCLPASLYCAEKSCGKAALRSNLTFRQYQNKIAQIKRRLFDGDTYQVNLSQRFSIPFSGDPFEVFQKVSRINPSSHQFFCEDKAFAVISNSPELLIRGLPRCSRAALRGVKTENGILLETKPIKGTVPRGKNSREDARNIKKLLVSKKDEAELSMIVDLERNDLGKVCEAGSVRVSQHREVQKYSHVIHTVSTIQGVLEKHKDVFDAIEAVFPGGSITGCPKKRTMEIIDELENFKRGVYCGSAGFISLNGNFEFNIMIRTMFLKNGCMYFHSGGGIVVDSNPKIEYMETLDKARALTESLFTTNI